MYATIYQPSYSLQTLILAQNESYLDAVSELGLISGRDVLCKDAWNPIFQLFPGLFLGGWGKQLGRGSARSGPLMPPSRASACSPTPVVPVTPHQLLCNYHKNIDRPRPRKINMLLSQLVALRSCSRRSSAGVTTRTHTHKHTPWHQYL